MSEDEAIENAQGPAAPLRSGEGGLVGKLFRKNADNDANKDAPSLGEGVAYVPASIMTVEYVDENDAMDEALQKIDRRLHKLEEQASTMQHTQSELINAVNQQAREIGKWFETIGRRLDKLYKRTLSSAQPTSTPAGPSGKPVALSEMASAASAAQGSPGELPEELADDPDHKNAWRVARVLAADLEAYHGEQVKEGVLYDTFYKLLEEPIEKARTTYEQRVPKKVLESYDYLSKALNDLVLRRRTELQDGSSDS
ncbi:MAG: hypothetical protein J7M08_00695 [Planctomycetes bacterium]|nr:hypothetical protein [Planctomycetota bacterium]